MKRFPICLFLFFLWILSCENRSVEQNVFSSSVDTLRITTTKTNGTGIFGSHSTPLRSVDTSYSFVGDIIYPKGIDSLKRAEISVDFVAKFFHEYMRGNNKLSKYVTKYAKLNLIDTVSCKPETESLLNIIEGYVDGERVLIVDQNNNRNFSDDTIRLVHEMEWDNPEDFIEFQYSVYNGLEYVDEKSWLGFKINKDDGRIFWGKKEHLLAQFKVGSKDFTIDIARPLASDFVYDFDDLHPYILAFNLVSENDETNDLDDLSYTQLGQYIRLEDQYYCLHNITRDGKTLTVIKEDNFAEKVGLQIGMKAPEFFCIAQNGDTIQSKDLKGRGILIVNMCGCGEDYESIQAYNEILSEFGDDFHILGVDSQFFSNTEGILINSQDPRNEKFYKNYRQMYCSRTVFVIDEGFRMSKTFDTTDWKDHLCSDEI